MPYALATADGTLLVGMSDGRVLRSDGAGFEEVAALGGAVLAIAAQ